MEAPQRVRRAANACKQCRSRKVKCSGTQPCDKCQFRRQECVFEEDRKIMVSEELFLSLKRKVDDLEGQPMGNKRPRTSSDTSRDLNHSHTTRQEPEPATPRDSSEPPESHRFVSNPLISPSRYIKHTGRRQRTWLFLGPTSTWSFSRRVLKIMQDRLNPGRSSPIPMAVDGDAYQLHWGHASSDEPPDISGLPSLEYALYLLNTVKFRLSPLYRLFDENEFLRNMYEFYDDAPAKVRESRLWYVQYLVIMAFGEAFLVPVRTASNTSGWTKYFTRAMSLLPDTTALWNDPVLAMEVLALIALYFHSVDMRDTAYCYIGHSMRLNLVEGHHRALPVDQFGEELAERCNYIWWTVYILDRKFSSLIGSPNSVNDDDITAVLWDPKTCPHDAAALSLHVKISQVVSRVLNTVYSVDGRLGGVYLRRVRSVLQEMTDLSRELDDVFAHRFRNSVDALSGVTTRLTLSCHSCIIVTIRPLILSLLWDRITSFEEGEPFRTLSGPVQTLVEACIDSATKSLKILTALRDHHLLESFLPFDLENLFSASFILTLISTILPDSLADHTYREMSFSLLDEMIARGNQVARMRKSEIELLEELIQPLQRQRLVNREEPKTPQRDDRYYLETPLSQGEVPGHAHPPNTVAPTESVLLPEPGQEEDLLFDWRDFGMSLNQMLSATDQINADQSIGAEELQADLWMWNGG
ncbi:hypothetical protein PHISCL_00109 [Aspergillus sclerotialis]|uniref:Zn(2)-C6 fungal-type domain-containing protein n=1 Tax=Aspergillus sclerotialis TaxID=2070753 RepID=A0A3A2ZYU8_9EURO|nr:hypothetical protein PHISCL_00109 [Aspergillus sclerotialis]